MNRKPLDKQAARDEDLLIVAFIFVASLALFGLLLWLHSP